MKTEVFRYTYTKHPDVLVGHTDEYDGNNNDEDECAVLEHLGGSEEPNREIRFLF